MTRCIHCTRCIRFATEVAGVEELGALGRGEHMEITTYLQHSLTSELSGNLADICPVGALTHKPNAFSARSWELSKTESIDAQDAVGSNIRVDSRGPTVMRVLPRLHEDINEEWISDKTRYAVDGLRRRRLDTPYVRRDGKLVAATWREIAAIAGDMACAESMMALKDLMDSLGSANVDCRQDGAKLDASVRAGYLFNTTIAGIEAADACLLIGTNPRWEAALVNARLRKRHLMGGFTVAAVGPSVDLTYPVEYLGAGPQTLTDIATGSHPFRQVLAGAERPMLIVGQGALARPDGGAVLAAARRIAEQTGMVGDGWNGFNLLHTAAARVAGLDVGLVPGDGGRDVDGILSGAEQGEIEAVYLLGADEIDMDRLGQAFVIYQGHHGDAGAQRADVVLPGAAYTEKRAIWINTEGRVQLGQRAAFPPGEAREDWTILRALSETLGQPLPYDNQGQLRLRMAGLVPHLSQVDEIVPAEWGAFGTPGEMGPAPFAGAVTDFYMTNPICRASATMAECSELFTAGRGEATGTHG
jgi:NADH-quinone oxidoreductase subunit G